MARTVVENWQGMNRKRAEPRLPHVSTVLKKGQWSGRPAVVVGGGPSAVPFLERLSEFPARVAFMGVNMSWRIDPMPEVAYGLDRQLFDLSENGNYRKLWLERAESQVRVTGHHNATYEWAGVYWVHQSNERGKEWGSDFGDEKGPGIIASNNAGLGALNLADVLGADPIVLVGFDAYREGKRLNWHEDYPDKPGFRPRRPENTYDRWKLLARTVAPKVRARLLNVNPESQFGLGELVTFEEALKACE